MSQKVGQKRKYSSSNRVFRIFNVCFWILIMAIILYPLYLVLIASGFGSGRGGKRGSHLAPGGLFTDRI